MINRVSFGSKINIPDITGEPQKRSNPSLYEPIDDSYIFTTKKTTASSVEQNEVLEEESVGKTSDHNKQWSNWQKILAVGVATAVGAAGGAGVNAAINYEPMPETAFVEGINNENILKHQASLHGVSVEDICEINGCDSVDELLTFKEVKIADKYFPQQERLEELQLKIRDKNLSSKKCAEFMNEIFSIQSKIEAQNETAAAYQDGAYVCFQMKQDVMAGDFKNIWGIEKNALKNHNKSKLEPEVYYVFDEDTQKLYPVNDYDKAILYAGKRYVVPVRAIHAEDIK